MIIYLSFLITVDLRINKFRVKRDGLVKITLLLEINYLQSKQKKPNWSPKQLTSVKNIELDI